MAKRALVVDDDSLMQRALARELLRKFHVVLASNAKESSEHLSNGSSFDVVVSDLHLGSGPNGVDVLIEAQKRHPGCARILVSGEIERPTGEKILQAGIADFVFVKPWEPGDILSAVEATLHVSGASTNLASSGVRPVAERFIVCGAEERPGRRMAGRLA